jgi:uncharacterized damage-inducible protein DinB
MTTPSTSRPEVWLRGPIDGVPALLQPVAHALRQATEEVRRIMQDFPEDELWERPQGLASVGFHLQHLSGVLDRLTTYARGELLGETQLAAMKAEGSPPHGGVASHALIAAFEERVARTLDVLRATDEGTLTQPRVVGRSGLPSTVLGLLFHGAEHTMRHVGQLLVTARVVSGAARDRDRDRGGPLH